MQELPYIHQKVLFDLIISFRSSFGSMYAANDTRHGNYCEFLLYFLIHKKILSKS